MEKNKLNDSLMAVMIEEEAWKELSMDFPWTEELLIKHRSKVDWDKISCNSNIKWTVSMLERFRRNINWTEFSSSADDEVLIPEIVEKFEEEWDWKVLSSNSYLTFELVAKYADKWDWKQLISYYRHDDLFSQDFLDMFIDYIPADEFRDSGLWHALVERKEKELKKQIIMG